MKKEEKLQDAFIALLICVPSFIFGGYVGMRLWNWFVSDTFNLMQLSLWQAVGLDTVITYFTYHCVSENKEQTKSYPTTVGIVKKLIISAVFLGIGFIVKHQIKI